MNLEKFKEQLTTDLSNSSVSAAHQMLKTDGGLGSGQETPEIIACAIVLNAIEPNGMTGRWLMDHGYIDAAGILRAGEEALEAFPDASAFMANILTALHMQEAAK